MHEPSAGGDPREPHVGASLERGVSLVSILAVLLILGMIYLGYDTLRRGGPIWAENTAAGLHASAATACRLNRMETERTILTWTISHPGQTVTLEELRKAGLHVPDCPDGGRLELEGRRVLCSLHDKKP